MWELLLCVVALVFRSPVVVNRVKLIGIVYTACVKCHREAAPTKPKPYTAPNIDLSVSTAVFMSQPVVSEPPPPSNPLEYDEDLQKCDDNILKIAWTVAIVPAKVSQVVKTTNRGYEVRHISSIRMNEKTYIYISRGDKQRRKQAIKDTDFVLGSKFCWEQYRQVFRTKYRAHDVKSQQKRAPDVPHSFKVWVHLTAEVFRIIYLIHQFQKSSPNVVLRGLANGKPRSF